MPPTVKQNNVYVVSDICGVVLRCAYPSGLFTLNIQYLKNLEFKTKGNGANRTNLQMVRNVNCGCTKSPYK